MSALLTIPVSVGELLDKISILEIKLCRIYDAKKLVNVSHELSLLKSAAQEVLTPDIEHLLGQLRDINESLWDVEDALRKREAAQSFGEEFVRLARSVYFLNDQRSQLKSQINEAAGSELREEKAYVRYANDGSQVPVTFAGVPQNNLIQ